MWSNECKWTALWCTRNLSFSAEKGPSMPPISLIWNKHWLLEYKWMPLKKIQRRKDASLLPSVVVVPPWHSFLSFIWKCVMCVYVLTHPCWGCCASTFLSNGSKLKACKWTANVIQKNKPCSVCEPLSQTCIWASAVKGPQERGYCTFVMFFTPTLMHKSIWKQNMVHAVLKNARFQQHAGFYQVHGCGHSQSVSAHNSEKEKEESVPCLSFKPTCRLEMAAGRKSRHVGRSMLKRSQTLEDTSWEIAPG